MQSRAFVFSRLMLTKIGGEIAAARFVVAPLTSRASSGNMQRVKDAVLSGPGRKIQHHIRRGNVLEARCVNSIGMLAYRTCDGRNFPVFDRRDRRQCRTEPSNGISR